MMGFSGRGHSGAALDAAAAAHASEVEAALSAAYAASISGRAAPLVVVKDGVTPHSDLISAALATDRDIILENGVWNLSRPIYPHTHGQRIMGSGNTTLLLDVMATPCSIVDCTNFNNVHVERLKIDGQYPLNQGNGWSGVLFNNSVGGWVKDCHIVNCRSDLNDVKGVYVLDSSRIIVLGCVIQNSNNNYLVQRSSYNVIANCILEDNYMSEAISIFSNNPTVSPAAFNTATNCVIRNGNTGVNIEGSSFNTVVAMTIDNCRDGLSIYHGGNVVMGVTIKFGDRALSSTAGINCESAGEATNTANAHSVLSGIVVDVNGQPGRGVSCSNIVNTGVVNFTLRDVKVTDSTNTQTGSYDGLLIEHAYGIRVVDCHFSNMSGLGVFVANSANTVANRSSDIELINCTVAANKGTGIYVAPNAVTDFRITGGTIKNNSQSAPLVNNGLYVSAGNYSVVCTARVFDDQDSPTQVAGGVYTESNNTIPYNTTPPTQGFWIKGQEASKLSLSSGSSPGAVCVNRKDATLTAQVNAGEVSMSLSSTSTMQSGDFVGIKLDNGIWHWSTINSVGSPSSLVDAIPAGRYAPNGTKVVTFRWAAKANVGVTTAAGDYWPTPVADTNVDAVSADNAQWMQVGNTVHVAGRLTVDPTSTNTITRVRIPLPVASDFSAIADCSGVAFCPAISGQGAAISADITNNQALMTWKAVDTTSQDMRYTFTYKVR